MSFGGVSNRSHELDRAVTSSKRTRVNLSARETGPLPDGCKLMCGFFILMFVQLLLFFYLRRLRSLFWEKTAGANREKHTESFSNLHGQSTDTNGISMNTSWLFVN